MITPVGVTAHHRARLLAQSSPTNRCISPPLSDDNTFERGGRRGRHLAFMTFLVTDAALHRRSGAEHVTHRLAQRLRTVQHAEHALTDVQAAIDEV
jgi:hypothetical protein